MSNLLITVLRLVSLVFFVRAILSWFRPSPSSPLYPVVDAIYRATDPILEPIRRVIPPLGGLDLSVFIVILGINYFLIPLAAGL